MQTINYIFQNIAKKLFLTILLLLVCLFNLLLNTSTAQNQTPTFDLPVYSWGSVHNKIIKIRGSSADLAKPYLKKAFERYQVFSKNTIILEEFSLEEFNLDHKNSTPKADILISPGGTIIGNLNADENFYDLSHEIWLDELTDSALNQAIYNGKVIGLPHWELAISGIVYNKEIFKYFKLAIPKTQDEFMLACAKLLANGIIPIYLPYTESNMLFYQYPLDSLIQDSRVLNDLNNGILSYSSILGMKEIISWYKTMADQGYFGKDYIKNTREGMDKALKSQKYAMVIAWDTWLYTAFTGNPSNFGIMPAFMGLTKEGSFGSTNLSLLIVNKKSPNLKAALDLLNFMADPYNYNVAFENIYTAPAFKNQLRNIATPQYLENSKNIEKLYNESIATLRILGFSPIDAIYIQKYLEDEQYSVEDCLKDMDLARIKRAIKINK